MNEMVMIKVEQLKALLNKQYREYRNRMEYIRRHLRWRVI